jgi:hypothetical protein
MPHSPPKADWMSFVLHFLFGLAVGAVVGFAVMGRRRGIWLDDDLILPWIIGTALIGAGFGARMGDSLWMSFSENAVHSDTPAHSGFTKWLCSLSALIGLALVATSLFKNFYKP